MGEEQSRPFSSEERAFLEDVAAKLPSDNNERLRHDIQIARVTPDGDFLSVVLPGYSRPEYRGHHNLSFEGKMRDIEGGPVSVLVNMDENDRLLAVEFIFWDSHDALDWATLTLVPEWPLGASQ